MKLNKTTKGTGQAPERVAGGVGAISSRISKLQELQRSVLACLLWENIAYENGENIAQRIATLVPQVDPAAVSALAVTARTQQKLRDVPLLLVREMARHEDSKPFVAQTLDAVIQRADQLSEFLAIYWKDKKQPLSAQVKKGLARAILKFDEYALSKYNRENAIKLRDVLFLTHAKPKNKAQGNLWKRLIDDTLKPVATWEHALSETQGANKKEAWETIIPKMGAMALIRNLRNFEEQGVDRELVKKALRECNPEKVLPFRFITAVKHAPRWQAELESLMLRAIENKKILKGKTVAVIDVSGSMGAGISAGSEMNRLEAAASIAILLREMCEDIVIYATAGNDHSRIHKTELVRPHRGFALRDEVVQKRNTLGGGGIFLKQALDYVQKEEKNADRVIVFTDEADMDNKANPSDAPAFGKNNYIINISVEKGGIAYKKFHHINGFSEAVLDYIAAHELLGNTNDVSRAFKML